MEKLFEQIYQKARLREMYSDESEEINPFDHSDAGFESPEHRARNSFNSDAHKKAFVEALYKKALDTGLYELTRSGNLKRKDGMPITPEERKTW